MMLQPSQQRRTAALTRKIPMNRPRQPRARSVKRAGVAVLTAIATTASPATAVADSTDDYPIPTG
jgi:hypothetical protein